MQISDQNQRFDIRLEEIIPEYYSKNPIVRWLFNRRLYFALEYLEKTNPHFLIDIGCGDGHFLKLISQHKIKITEMWGIDINEAILELKGEIQNSNFKVQDIFKTDFNNETFDMAVCLDVLEHIEKIGDAVIEIKRILKYNGFLIISEPTETFFYKTLRFMLKGTYSHESGPCAGMHYYNAKKIDSIIQKNGFTKVSSKKVPIIFPFDLFHVNLYKKYK